MSQNISISQQNSRLSSIKSNYSSDSSKSQINIMNNSPIIGGNMSEALRKNWKE